MQLCIGVQWISTGLPVHHSDTWALCRQIKLVTCRELFKSHGKRSQNQKFLNDLNTTKRDKDSPVFASPANTRYPLMLRLGGPLHKLATGYQVPFNSWVDWSNVSKVPCSEKQQHQHGVSGNQTHDVLIMRSMARLLGYVHTHTHTDPQKHTIVTKACIHALPCSMLR